MFFALRAFPGNNQKFYFDIDEETDEFVFLTELHRNTFGVRQKL
jgi:hypothetical protein